MNADHPRAPVDLTHIVEEVGHLLPQQGPISIFVHHNTLHAFEDRPFEDAVVQAGQLFDCAPFLPEEQYRDELRRGRIDVRDIDDVLRGELGDAGAQALGTGLTRFDVRRHLVIGGIPPIDPQTLPWVLSETSALSRFRPDAQRAGSASEADAVHALWDACRAHVAARPPAPRAVRCLLRDRVQRGLSAQIDALVDPVLIRFTSAFLDQGMARQPMPGRELGMRACFHELYGSGWAAKALGVWGGALPGLIATDRVHPTAEASIGAALESLGVAEEDWAGYLTETALVLRGWAGMVRQVEVRPDRVPAMAVPARLADFLALRLLLERAAAAYLRPRAPAPELAAPAPPITAEVVAWPLFQLAQLCGLTAHALTEPLAVVLRAEIDAFDDAARRRVLHLAYERTLRQRYYDALLTEAPALPDAAPVYQAVFCIDDREESMRRHLEEADDGVETLGAAGFFGVAMYYRGVHEAHPRALCPVAIRPRHFVAEVPDATHPVATRWWRAHQTSAAVAGRTVLVGSRSPVMGAAMSVLGVFALLPLVLRVIFPRLGERLQPANLLAIRHTRLELDRSDVTPPQGECTGFTPAEMADIVEGLLRNLGIAHRVAPLVLVLGHGSSSVNNPQASAYDCGACAGAHGGPNARAFAQMANDPRVRRILGERGVAIGEDTWFVGGERNTCTNEITFFDEVDVPAVARPLLERARASFDRAREAEAHERARRFEAVPTWAGARLALGHVAARGVDLAQPRPEAGHATNALAFVGRRMRTHHLFLDRRAFLNSYDPTTDPDGTVLARLLSAVVPVMVGINLEYYFGRVDPTGYGCGTKLPHNVAAMLGVMDGAQSDLRTGLSWQMVELHEPVRLTLVVECMPQTLLRLIAENESLQRLVHNRWLWVACLAPDRAQLWELRDGQAVPIAPRSPVEPARGGSIAAYRGNREHLPFRRVVR